MKMKKIVALVATVAMTTSLLVGCGSKDDKSKEDASNGGDATTKQEFAIGLTTDEGGLNDKSFNQSANEGVEKAVKEFGVKYTPLEATKKEDYEVNLQSLIDAEHDLALAIGFQLADAVANIAENNPDSKIAIIDGVVPSKNVMSITFKEEEGSFLMGVIAGLTTKTNKVGFIGGKDFDTIQKFEAGFVAGVKSVNPEAAVDLLSKDGKNPGPAAKYADSFADTNKGYELAKSLYESGCDVIYHSAGGVGIGMFTAAKEMRDNGKEVWAIGVDMDQAVTVPEYKDVILSSMIKRVDKATYDASKSIVDGTFKGGSLVLGIKEGGVGMADTTADNTEADVVAKAKEYEEKIKSGELKVPATRQEAIDFK